MARKLNRRGRAVKPGASSEYVPPYAGRVNRTAGPLGFLIVIALWLGTASAHEDQEFHLADAKFCVDPASVQVVLDLPSPERTASAQKVLKRDLMKMLTATLDHSGVAYEVKERCTDARNYALLSADVRYLDPETYIGFGEGAHNYSLFLQVGGYADAPSAQLLEQLPTSNYSAYLGEIYAEGDEGKPFEPLVVSEGSKLVQGLTAYWWEDNPRRSLRAVLLPPLLGGTLALLSGVAAWWALRRRGASKKSRHSSSG